MDKYKTLRELKQSTTKDYGPAMTSTERARLYRLRKAGIIVHDTPYDQQMKLIREYKRITKPRPPKMPNKFRQRLKKQFGLTLGQLSQYSEERQAEIFKQCNDTTDRRRTKERRMT